MSAVMVETPQEAARRLAAPAIREGFQPTALHCYNDADGTPAFWRIRAKHPDGRKWIRPMQWDGAAYVIGEPASPAGGKLLYRLPELLAADPADTLWIAEGETCADALASLGLVATTSGASDSARVADWSPLRGRTVRIWPDNDAVGRKYADAVAERLRALACAVEVLDVAALDLPNKGDCVDWLREHPDAAADVAMLPVSKLEPNRKPDTGPRVILRRGSEVQPVAVDWLWSGWLAAGKLHLIGGAPGTGKTTIATALAATVTQGGRWPDGARAGAGSVVIWSGEDDNADTINPRLRAAGANMARVHVVEGVRGEDGQRYPFDPAQDMDALREALRSLPDVRLIVVDPIVSAVAGDSHKNAEVRRGLQPLVDLAGEFGCALVGVTHFTKGTAGRDPVERITGSLAFAALARLVMVTAKQEADGDRPERPERRVILRAKSNIGPDGGGFVYDLQQGELEGFPGVTASRVQWGEAVTGSARELLAEAESVDSERTATDEAADWLRDTLESGPMPAGEVLKLAKLSGISEKAIRTARERIGIKPKRSGFGPGGRVTWALPPIDAQPAHRCPQNERASMYSEGIYGGEEGMEVIDL